MSLNLNDALILGAGGLIFIGCISFVIVALYIAYTKLDVMLGCFKNSPAVMIRAPLRNGGPWGRLFVLGSIVGVLKAPGLYIADGGACVSDISSFPQDLKKRLITLYRIGGHFGWALLIYAVMLLVDWSTMSTARLIAAASTISTLLVWLLLCIHIGETQIGKMADGFKRSEAIQIRLRLESGGCFGKVIFAVAASIITCSSIFIKRGTLNYEDYKSMSKCFKYKLLLFFYDGWSGDCIGVALSVS